MIRNFFWALGPNVTGYAGGYPCGFLERCRKEGYWGDHRLHLCSGSVRDGTTVDIRHDLRPTVCCDLEILGVPFKPSTFDAIFIDPPYSEDHAKNLYGVPLLSVPRLVRDAARCLRPNGLIVILDWTAWVPMGAGFPRKQLDNYALGAVYVANRGYKRLRAVSVFRATGQSDGWFD